MADSKEWENLVIETGVDSMMDYLAEHGSASLDDITEEIGVEKPRLKKWADALSEEKLINKHHTITSGLILEYTDENVEESEKKKQEIEEDLNKKSEDLQSRLEQKGGEIAARRKELVNKEGGLNEKEKKKAVQETIERLEVIETRIDRHLEQDNIDKQTIDLILEIEEILKQVEQLIRQHLAEVQGQKLNKKAGEAVQQVQTVLDYAEESDEYVEQEQAIRRELKAMKKLEKNIEKARSTKNEGNSKGILEKLKLLLPIKKKEQKDEEKKEKVEAVIDSSQKIRKEDVPEHSYDELVNENRITEVMRKISLIKDPDYEALMKAEMANKARPELVNYLEERVEDGR